MAFTYVTFLDFFKLTFPGRMVNAHEGGLLYKLYEKANNLVMPIGMEISIPILLVKKVTNTIPINRKKTFGMSESVKFIRKYLLMVFWYF